MNDEELRKSIIVLTKYERKLSSLHHSFWRGVFYGFGFFIGSAILAGLFIWVLSHIGGDTYFGRLIERIVDIVDKTRK
jgi:hypothetical protein